jgi:hypothetical protein
MRGSRTQLLVGRGGLTCCTATSVPPRRTSPRPLNAEEGGVPADPPEEREVFAPGYHPEELKEIANRLLRVA